NPQCDTNLVAGSGTLVERNHGDPLGVDSFVGCFLRNEILQKPLLSLKLFSQQAEICSLKFERHSVRRSKKRGRQAFDRSECPHVAVGLDGVSKRHIPLNPIREARKCVTAEYRPFAVNLTDHRHLKLGVTWTVNCGKAILFPLKCLSIFQLAIDLDASLP